MTIHRKKIETFQVNFRTKEQFDFSQIITSPEVVKNDARIKGKNVELSILEDNDRYIVGLVETNRNDNIPPKKNRRDKSISPLGLSSLEGLAYGNVFIYEKRRAILMYEVNKSGCFIDHFIEYLYKCCEGSTIFRGFDIDIKPILKSNEYNRMLRMSFYKSIELKFANPSQILNEYTHKNDAIWNACDSAKSMNSKKVLTKFEVPARGNNIGLSSMTLREVIDRALKLLRGPKGNNVEKIEVYGYETDSEDNKLVPVDLIADRYLKEIILDEPRENTDLLQRQRYQQITELYEKCRPDFDEIFGKGDG